MATLGHALLVVGLVLCAGGIVASVRGSARWGRRAVYLLAAALTAAFAVLEVAFLRSDFAFDVVQEYSSTGTPTFYKVTAPWSSQAGSLLLWVWLLSLWSALVLRLTRKRLADLAPYATAVLLGFGAFFLGLCLFFADPFATSANPPPEGMGLTPLLRHPMMMIHPPALYSGYTLFTIPFAFAVGALIAGRLDAAWIRATRRFALAAWCALAIGIVLGARWSYTELGWGGYWAWDPVENASLLPWLTGTAFLHSVMIQERRGMLKTWNASLILATGTLAVVGTFLVRSGILDSIHAFGASTVGIPFLVLIAVMVAASVGLVVWRRDRLRSAHHLDSLLSREAMFVLNNIVLVGLAFVVFWGTFFPLISEALTGRKSALGPPWFDQYTVPLAIVLVLLSGIGPAIAWRRATPRKLLRVLGLPVIGGAVAAVVAGVVGGVDHPSALAMFGCAGFALTSTAAALTSTAAEVARAAGARAAATGQRRLAAVPGLVARNRRRYGGYVVHVGIAVLFVGVAASSSFQHAEDRRVRPGESFTVGDHRITYVRATAAVSSDPDATGAIMTLGAVVRVERDGRVVATLRPTRNYFPVPNAAAGSVGRLIAGEPTSEVALRAGPFRDLWAAFTPDIQPLDPLFERANQRIPAERGDLALTTLALIALSGALLALAPSLRRRRGVVVAAGRREALEAAREAKYREIRDAEEDLRTGKLDEQGHAAIDEGLRAEAVDILRELDSEGERGRVEVRVGVDDPA